MWRFIIEALLEILENWPTIKAAIEKLLHKK
jgi:hypothetical protein